jgi:hypothetical protein
MWRMIYSPIAAYLNTSYTYAAVCFRYVTLGAYAAVITRNGVRGGFAAVVANSTPSPGGLRWRR